MPALPPDPAALLAADRRLRVLASQLVADARAEDVAQETWVAALQHGGPVHSLGGWLTTVARRLALRGHRSDKRRAARERGAAVPDELPSTADILAREDARARVVEAVLALHEPLRTTVVLRFLEDLPPREVARRMRVSGETVRARTHAALELLRARLDRSLGSRASRMSALLPLALPRPPGTLALAAMTLQTKVLVSAVALALLGFLLAWPRDDRVGPARAEESPHADLGAPVEPSGASVELAQVGTLGAGDARSALAPPPATDPAPLTADAGALGVRVSLHTHAGITVGAGFVVRVTSDADENPELLAREAATDGSGVARFERLPPGGANVSVDRRFGPLDRVEIVAGETAELAITVAPGFTVLGLVTDEESRPVADAEVWFGKFPDLAHGTLVARSAADGTFRLEALGHANLGARANGYRPSQIAYLYAAEDAEVPVHLVLRAGAGEVHGTVVDLAGEPVEGAFVRVGPPGPPTPSLLDELDVDWGTRARTDVEGRFAIRGLAPGPAPVAVRAAGHALGRGEVAVVAGVDVEWSVTLAAEPVLAGRVLDALGAPVAGARVTVGEESGPFRASALSGADGAFRVGALEDGREYAADVRADAGIARTDFVARAGETHTWEAMLAPLGIVHGVVVDARDAPLAHWGVRLHAEGVGHDPDSGYTLTDAAGRFRFEGVHERAHVLTVEAAGSFLSESLVKSGVRPGGDELVLRIPDERVPSAHIRGTFLDEDGRALPTAQVLAFFPYQSTGAAAETCDPRTGRFETGPYPPGDVHLILRAPGRAMLVREHALAADETWDVGEIRLAPEGRLRVRLVAAGVEPDERVRLQVHGAFDGLEGAGPERLSPPLAPGAYVLTVSGGGAEELALRFTIESGAETALDVPLRRGWRTKIAVRGVLDTPLAFVRVTLPDGRTLERGVERDGELAIATLHLAPGTYPVEACAVERRASGTLVVAPVDRDEPALVLELD